MELDQRLNIVSLNLAVSSRQVVGAVRIRTVKTDPAGQTAPPADSNRRFEVCQRTTPRPSCAVAQLTLSRPKVPNAVNLRASGAIVCWGRNDDDQSDAPPP